MELLPVADVVMDGLYYANKAAPREIGGRHALSASLTRATPGPSMPPSLKAEIVKFTSNDAMRLSLPAAAHAPIVSTAFVDACTLALANASPVGETGFIPISTVEWDNHMLEWGRVGVDGLIPACAYGAECRAANLANAPGPLQVYLSPDEEAAVKNGAPVPGFACLLCIRADINGLDMLHRQTIVNSAVQTGRPLFVVPPFQNLVDCPGGYVSKAIGAHAGPVLPVNVVGVTNTLVVARHPHSGTHFVDQGAIVYGARLNGGAAPAGSLSAPVACCA